MLTFANWIRSIRVSNLIFLAFLPFVIYFIATSRNYGKALKSILGIEDNAVFLLSAFLVISVIGILGFIASLKLNRSIRLDIDKNDKGIRLRVRVRVRVGIWVRIRMGVRMRMDT